MKKDIHPKYNTDCQVTCVCGNTFKTGSTASEIKVELCSACHPFYTGKQKFIDTGGRVEKFQAKLDAKTDVTTGKKVKKAARAKAKSKKEVVVKTKDIKKIAQVSLGTKK
ncbi:MAG: 50S ribosomal protein L31 [Patescibacteria group bacterium]|nr:50S ribosomal protein L31 [Patescibacteria group bacterium]